MISYRAYFYSYRAPFCSAVVCVCLEAFCDLLGPTMMAKLINTGVEQGSLAAVFYWGKRMLAVAAAGALFAAARNILSGYVSQRFGADLRRDLFIKIIGFSAAAADRFSGGSLMTRMTNDTAQVVQFVNGMMRIFLKAPVTGVGSIVLASMLNLRLSLIIYGVVAVVALLIAVSMKYSYPRFARLQTAVDRVNSIAQEYLIGIRLVKAFGTQRTEEARFAVANRALTDSGAAAQMIITWAAPLLKLTVGAGTVLVIYVGSLLFPARLAGVGDIAAFTVYMAQILISLLVVTNVFNVFVRTRASAARIREVFDGEADFAGDGGALRLRGAVEFDRVVFAYPGGSGIPALRSLSFSLEPGRSLAIIGPTGGGKSTVAWLLLRFYDVDAGRILLDGRDIKSLPAAAVRANIAVVPQKPQLFSGSIADNLRWGAPDASPDRLRAAARAAQADFCEKMPRGLDSTLGDGAVNLSGGQKQRLAIARGLLKDAPILLLDDAASALDVMTEAKVRAALLGGGARRTTIFITQRCAAAMFCDRILVLENGACRGFGTHGQLLADCAAYRAIYRSQINGVEEA